MLDTAPLWAIGLMLLGLMALAFWIGTRVAQARSVDDAGDSGGGHVLSGVLGLLALLMAFAFSMAISRHDERRELVVQEANALSTMHQRLALLGDAAPAARRTLAGYAGARTVVAVNPDIGKASRLQADAERQFAQFERQVMAALLSAPPDARLTVIVPVLNELGDIATERRAARRARLPGAVMLLLAMYCVIGAGTLGHTLPASGRQHRPAAMTFLALIAFAYVLVLDIDRPRGGLVTVPQDELLAVADMLRAESAEPR